METTIYLCTAACSTTAMVVQIMAVLYMIPVLMRLLCSHRYSSTVMLLVHRVMEVQYINIILLQNTVLYLRHAQLDAMLEMLVNSYVFMLGQVQIIRILLKNAQ